LTVFLLHQGEFLLKSNFLGPIGSLATPVSISI